MVGSFGNVVVHRVPIGASLLSPPSHCPSCNHAIRYRHNVPLLSWLLLRGRCSDCDASISSRYPLVELGTGALFLAVSIRMAAVDQLAALPAYLCFAALAVVLALIDLDTHRLPNSIVLPAYPVLGVLLTVAAAWQQQWADLERSAAGAAILFAFYLVVATVYPAGMGMGDVKLSGLIGAVLAYLSWGALVTGAFGAFVLGSLVGIAVIAAHRGSGKTALPFGPFMLMGALIGIFAGSELGDAYLALINRR